MVHRRKWTLSQAACVLESVPALMTAGVWCQVPTTSVSSEKSLSSPRPGWPEFEKSFLLCTVHKGQLRVPSPEGVLGEDGTGAVLPYQATGAPMAGAGGQCSGGSSPGGGTQVTAET